MTKPESKATGRDARRPHNPRRIDKVELCSIDSFPASDPPGWINSNQTAQGPMRRGAAIPEGARVAMPRCKRNPVSCPGGV
jgi:hypothetical protein